MKRKKLLHSFLCTFFATLVICIVTCNRLYAELNKSVDVANEDYRQYSLTSPYVSFPHY